MNPPLPPASTSNRIAAVVFDMDGVLIDSHPVHRRAWIQFLRTIGREVPESELNFILDGHKRTDILRHFLGDLSPAELEDFGRRKDLFFQQSASEVAPIPGVPAFVADLAAQDIALAVATSASETRTLETLERLQLKKYFNAIVTAGDVRRGKPDPAIYRIACERLNVAPSRALAVEDAVAGIEAARAAGLGACIAVANHTHAEKMILAGASLVIRDFRQQSFAAIRAALARTRSASATQSLPPTPLRHPA